MKKDLTNYAFIDSQNTNLGVRDLGWKLDWRRFRVHLAETYSVARAYSFIGYIQSNQQLYDFLEQCGYTLIFKTVDRVPGGKIKGNVDAELVLHAMIDYAQVARISCQT